MRGAHPPSRRARSQRALYALARRAARATGNGARHVPSFIDGGCHASMAFVTCAASTSKQSAAASSQRLSLKYAWARFARRTARCVPSATADADFGAASVTGALSVGLGSAADPSGGEERASGSAPCVGATRRSASVYAKAAPAASPDVNAALPLQTERRRRSCPSLLAIVGGVSQADLWCASSAVANCAPAAAPSSLASPSPG